MLTIPIGVDLAKTALEPAVSEAPGVVTARHRLSWQGSWRGAGEATTCAAGVSSAWETG